MNRIKVLHCLYTIFAIGAVFYALTPLLGERFIPTHDGEYHLIRFWQFHKMLISGHLIPRWAPDLNNGFGIPIFTFFYPFPNYVGSLYHLIGASFVSSVKLSLFSAYLIALLFCFLWIRSIFSAKAAIFGTLIGAFIPYWFLDIYIRGSVGEVWGISWVFASLLAVSKRRELFLSVAVCLLILSHNIMALIFTPIIVFYCFYKDQKFILNVLLGIGMASYFWVPAIYERQFIRGLSYVNVLDYFPQVHELLIPSWGSGFRGAVGGGTEMSYQIGIIPLFLILMTGIQLIRKRIDQTNDTFFAFWCICLSIVFMLPITSGIWQIFPVAGYIQYPWRLLSVIVIMTPVLAASYLQSTRYAWFVVLLSFMVTMSYMRPITYDPRNDSHYTTNPSFIGSTSSMGDAFQTMWTSGDLSTIKNIFSINGHEVRSSRNNPTVYHVRTNVEEKAVLTAPIVYYPGWKAATQGKSLTVFSDQNGLLSIRVPPGNNEVTVMLGLTPWQRMGNIMSIISLFVLVVSIILKRRQNV